MRRVRTYRLVSGLVALLLAGLATAGATASAAPQGPGSQWQLTAEQMTSAEVIPAPRADLAIMKGGPWSDPAPAYFNGDLSDDVSECSPGYACIRVHQYDSYYADFWYYNYGVYSLENWIGKGWLNNRQTGGATLRTLNASGRLIDCYEGDVNASVSYPDWTPVYYIQLSPQGC